jgi:hypothetical protein
MENAISFLEGLTIVKLHTVEKHTEFGVEVSCRIRPPIRLRGQEVDNIHMKFTEMSYEFGRWMKLAQDHV